MAGVASCCLVVSAFSLLLAGAENLALDREGVVYELIMQGPDDTQRLLPTIPDVNTVLLWLAV